MPDVTSAASVFAKEENDSTKTKFVEVLKRNLPAFGLERETVIGDGDCGFRSLAKQIPKLSRQDERFQHHFESLTLLGKTGDDDTFRLTQFL